MMWRLLGREPSIDPAQFTPWPAGGVLVGGAVRDALLGRPARDLDFLVPDPRAAARAHAEAVGGSAFVLDEARGHWRVVQDGRVRDFAPAGGSVDDDLLRRDFTVNAMGLEPDGTIRDPAGGLSDLRRRRLRMVSRANLADDPLRLVRGARLAVGLDFALDDSTEAAIRDLAREQLTGAVRMPAAERVRDELDLLIAMPTPGRAMVLLDRLGLLDVYLPELTEGRHVHQGGFHHLPVMQHMLEALHQLVAGFPDANLALRWATLLHDIGKPACRSVGDDGRVRFHGHARHGSTMAAALLRRLRHPRELVRRCAALVRYHMVQLPRNDREARRFVHRRREILPDLLELMIADREAARGPLSSEANRRRYRIALSRVLAILDEPPPEPPLLDGRAVMALLGLDEGPAVGKAMRFLQEARAVGDVTTRDEAVEALERYAEAQGWTE